MQQIAPSKITNQLETTVDSFFVSIASQIKQVEQQTLQRISNSKNLADLEKLLTDCEPTFGHSDEKAYELARQEIEGAVKKGSYSEVVQKKENYESLINSMQKQTQSMGSAIQESQKCIQKIMKVRQTTEASAMIGKRLHEIIDACLEIDVQDSTKRQKMEADKQA